MGTEVQPVASSSLWNQIFGPYDHSIGPELDLQATKGRFGLRPPSHPLLHRAPWKGPTTKHNITLGNCCYTKNKHILPSKHVHRKLHLNVPVFYLRILIGYLLSNPYGKIYDIITTNTSSYHPFKQQYIQKLETKKNYWIQQKGNQKRRSGSRLQPNHNHRKMETKSD